MKKIIPISQPLKITTHKSGGKSVMSPSIKISASVQFLDINVTENTLKTDAKGNIYCGVTCANEKAKGGILRSSDNGKSWERMIPEIPGDKETVINASMGSIAVDQQTGRLFVSSCGDPTCVPDNPWSGKIAKLLRDNRTWSDTLVYSDDQGESWHILRGQFKDGGDWGKTFLGPPAIDASKNKLSSNNYPNIIYHLAGATFSLTQYCWKSLDGGKSFQLTKKPVFSNYTRKTPLPYGGEPEIPAGYPRIDDTHTLSGVGVVTADGTIYIPANICGFPRIYISRDEGDSWSFLDIPVAKVRGIKTYDGITGIHEPPNGGKPYKPQQPFHKLYGSTGMSAIWSQQLAIDEDERFYLSWVDARDDLPYLSISNDRGKTWNKPLMISAPGVNMASISAIAVRNPGEVVISYYGSRDGGWSFDGFITLSRNALDADPIFHSAQTCTEAPIQYNRLGEPCEFTGAVFTPDGTAWASFSRDTCVIDDSSGERQCDGNFEYNGTRFYAVIAKLGKDII